jgi:hypothetical protein
MELQNETYESDLDPDVEYGFSEAYAVVLRQEKKNAEALRKAYGSPIPIGIAAAPSELEPAGRVQYPYLLQANGVWVDDFSFKNPQKLCDLADVAVRRLRTGIFSHYSGSLIKFIAADGQAAFAAIPDAWLHRADDFRAADRLRKAGLFVSPKKALNRHFQQFLASTLPPRW